MQELFTADALIGLLTLTALEIVLGVDNVIFISILAGKLPAAEQARARTIGLALAMVTRILLLLSLAWIANLTGECSRASFKRASASRGAGGFLSKSSKAACPANKGASSLAQNPSIPS